MRSESNRYLQIVVIALLMMICALLVRLIDVSVSSSLDNLRAIALKRESSDGIDQLERNIQLLTVRSDNLQTTISANNLRSLPSLDDLKRLSRSHRLTIYRLERVENGSDDKVSEAAYNATFVGTVGAAVRFLKDLSDTRIFCADQMIVQPVDDTGNQVALYFSIKVLQ